MKTRINHFIKRIFIAPSLVLILLGVALLPETTAWAASATVFFSTETPEVKIGEKVTVVVSFESSALVSTIDAYLSYDPKILQFKSGGSKVSGSDGLLHIEDTDEENTNDIKKYSITFIGLKKGACDVGLSDIPTIGDGNGNAMSYSSNRLSVVVKKSTKSKENRLKSLEISPAELSPSFEPDREKYEAVLPVEADKLFFIAKASDEHAKVEIIGNENLKIGENSVVIKVTAESGDVRNYTILAKRRGEKIQSLPSDEKESVKEEATFSIENNEGIISLENSYQFKIKEPKENIDIPEGYQKTKLILYGVNVPAYTMEKDLENDFLLFYAENENGEEGFYQYDRLEKTMQRYREEEKESDKNIISSDKITDVDQYNKKVEQLAVIIAVLTAFVLLLSILSLRLFIKQRGFREEEDEDLF